MRISDWSSDVCSSDLQVPLGGHDRGDPRRTVAAQRRRKARRPAIERRQLVATVADHRHAQALQHLQRLRQVEDRLGRSEEHTSELQSLMRISYAVFCLKKKKTIQ